MSRSENPDVCALWLEFESGLLGTLGTSFITPGIGRERHPYFINAYGDQGSFYHDRWTGTEIWRKGAQEAERIDYEEFKGFDYLGEELRDFTAAIAHYRESVRINPDFADAHFNLGRLLEKGGRRNEAIQHLLIYRRLTNQT